MLQRRSFRLSVLPGPSLLSSILLPFDRQPIHFNQLRFFSNRSLGFPPSPGSLVDPSLLSPEVLDHLEWLKKKDMIGQDVVLIGGKSLR